MRESLLKRTRLDDLVCERKLSKKANENPINDEIFVIWVALIYIYIFVCFVWYKKLEKLEQKYIKLT